MEKEILDILKSIQEGQKEIVTRIDNLEVGQKQLQAGQSKLEAGQKQLQAGQSKLEEKVDGLVKTVGAIYYQTANLTEFRTEVNIKLEELKEVKEVTKQNCYEIARIKAVK